MIGEWGVRKNGEWLVFRVSEDVARRVRYRDGGELCRIEGRELNITVVEAEVALAA
jgi:hypothetical protein